MNGRQLHIDLNSRANWCLSGGADGSDLQWGMTAGHAGHGVIHFSFTGHKTTAPLAELVTLTEKQLASADPYCRIANKTLRRRFPTKSRYLTNLMRRNWFQISFASACYAVSTLGLSIQTTIPIGTVIRDAQVKGGTAWAVTMFIDRHQRNACECYLFDQVIGHWFQWNDGWLCIHEPPKPQGIWAGIGSRDLNMMGKLAIRVLMDYQTDFHSKEIDRKYFAWPRTSYNPE